MLSRLAILPGLSLMLVCAGALASSAVYDDGADARSSVSRVEPAPRPGHVTASQAFDPSLDRRAPAHAGVRIRLHERDVLLAHDGSRTDWRVVEYRILNQLGLESHGRYSIGFDPARSRLQLHALSVQRAGGASDRLAATRIDLLRREPELESLQDGRLEASLLIPDLVPGDIVRIEWSVLHAPMPLPHEITVALDGERSVARRLSRIRTPLDRPLSVFDGRRPDARGAPVPTRVDVDGSSLHTVDQRNAPRAPARPASLPAEDREYARLVFTELPDWRAVASTLRPHYRPSRTVPDEVAREARRIRVAFAQDGDRAAAALQWAQTRVRYYALQIGAGAWRPRAPVETLLSGYGDCKDKTLLLLSLLQELDIEASAALTDLDNLLASPHAPWRLQAFDHVLVRATIDDRERWLDPTETHQRGSLAQRRAPDHGRALRLDSGELVAMRTPTTALPLIDVVRHVAQVDGAAVLEVRTLRAREAAEALRRDRHRLDDARLAASWLDYYRRRGLPVHPLAVTTIDDSDAGVTSVERYAIDDGASLNAFSSADEIHDRLLRWREQASGRGVPLTPGRALDLRERVLLERLRIDNDAVRERTIQTPWFTLQRVLRQHGADGPVVIDYRLVAQPARVGAEQLTRFVAALDDALALTGPAPIGERRRTLVDARTVGASTLLAAGLLCAARRRRRHGFSSSPKFTGSSMGPPDR